MKRNQDGSVSHFLLFKFFILFFFSSFFFFSFFNSAISTCIIYTVWFNKTFIKIWRQTFSYWNKI